MIFLELVLMMLAHLLLNHRIIFFARVFERFLFGRTFLEEGQEILSFVTFVCAVGIGISLEGLA